MKVILTQVGSALHLVVVIYFQPSALTITQALYGSLLNLYIILFKACDSQVYVYLSRQLVKVIHLKIIIRFLV
jgi:hypothetical protein